MHEFHAFLKRTDDNGFRNIKYHCWWRSCGDESHACICTSVSTAASQAAPALKKPDVTLPDKPAVSLPKRPEIQFNAAENRKNLQDAVSMLNEQVASHKNGLGFSINDHIDVPVVTVKNTVTGEVVRQIPNEVVLRVAQH